MKAEVIIEGLSRAISLADKATGKNLSLPLLANVFLGAKDNKITVRATNLEVGIEITINARVSQSGTAVVKGSILNSFLSHLSGKDKVALSLNNDNLTITTPTNSATIKSYPSGDFPTLPTIKTSETLELPAEDLIGGLRAVWYAASTSGIKPEINSVYWHQSGVDLVLAATDSFRLAEKKINLSPTNIKGLSLIVPARNTLEIIRSFENQTGSVAVSFDKNQLVIVGGEIYFTTRLIDGNFPDYQQIIPRQHETEVVILRQDWVNALKLANIFADKLSKISLNIDPKQQKIELMSRDSEIGNQESQLTATITGDPVTVSLNARYLLEAMTSLMANTINLKLNGANKPVIMTGVGDASFTYLIMPLLNPAL
ncbi:MAG: DNA polymerase III subunit beta [Patescibacteria group bacterium]